MSYEANIIPAPAGKRPSRNARKPATAALKKTAAPKSPAAKKAAPVKKTSISSKRRQLVVARATETFGSQDRALAWLKRPSAPLQGRTPQSLLTTDEGVRQVEQLLGRIDHGIAA